MESQDFTDQKSDIPIEGNTDPNNKVILSESLLSFS